MFLILFNINDLKSVDYEYQHFSLLQLLQCTIDIVVNE